MPTAPSDAVLPPGSLVLVTGANGFVGSHVANELLSFGYRVRGTVRDKQKSAWLQTHFDKTYGSGKFELVEVKSMVDAGSLDEAVKGCDGVAHVASDVSFGPDPELVIKPAVALTMNALEAAAKEPSVKRFVITSSSAAAAQGKYNEPYDLTPESWNTASLEAASAPPPYKPENALHVYSASKVKAEQAVWKFVEDRKPHFVANSVLPDFVCGAPIDLEKQGYPSSIGLLKDMWEGGYIWPVLVPQFEVNVRDVARLHVAALIAPDAKNERVFGYAHNKTWTDWIARLKKMYPKHQFPDPPPNEGKDMANVTAQPRALALLKWLGQSDWTPMEDSMREVCDTLP